jgi:Asp-tRNA(Asn)/Glu-tRNA(Gln) amidotransferase A subunit family amidase
MSGTISRRTALRIAAGVVLATTAGVGGYRAFRGRKGKTAMKEPAVPSSAEDLCFLPAVDLAQLVRAKKLSPTEVVQTVLARISAINPKLNAYCTLDPEGATAAARMIEQEIGNNHGLDRSLLGVPVAIKDDLEVVGLPCTSGSRLKVRDKPATEDDCCVERLRAAGAIILGKTNLPEFGHKGTTDNVLFGTTANPWDLSKSVGGSSGGNGAALAAGLAHLALGTDVGGSVRKPASFCGVVGLKPSFGRVPRVPAGNAFTIWVSGPMARDVTDTALMLHTIAGPDERDPFSLPELTPDERALDSPLPAKIGWVPDLTGLPIEPRVLQSARTATELLVQHGVKLETVPTPWPDAPLEALFVLQRVGAMSEAGITTEAEYLAVKDQLSPTFQRAVEAGLRVTRADYTRAQADATTFTEKAAALFERYEVLAMPTLTVPAFDKTLPLGPDQVNGKPINSHQGWALTWPFNLTGHPAISIPCGWTDDRLPLPIGLQIVAKRRADRLVLRVAAAIERAAVWPTRRPPIA